MGGGVVDNTQFDNFKMKLRIFSNHLFVTLIFIQHLGNIIWEVLEYIFGTLLWPLISTKFFRLPTEQGSL